MSGRPRRAGVEDAVGAAVLALLAEVGYGGATMDAIAARAGVGKPALYRRWPDRAALVADAFERALAAANPEAPPGGDPAAALRTVLRNLVRTVADSPFGDALAAVVGELGREPALAAAAAGVDARRRVLVESVLGRAEAAGRLRPGWTVPLAADALLGTVYFRAWVRRVPLAARDVAALVDGVIAPAVVG